MHRLITILDWRLQFTSSIPVAIIIYVGYQESANVFWVWIEFSTDDHGAMLTS